MTFDLGPVRLWKEGDILFADNDILLMAYAVADDQHPAGTEGWRGPEQIWVGYITPEKAKAWDGVSGQSAR